MKIKEHINTITRAVNEMGNRFKSKVHILYSIHQFHHNKPHFNRSRSQKQENRYSKISTTPYHNIQQRTEIPTDMQKNSWTNNAEISMSTLKYSANYHTYINKRFNLELQQSSRHQNSRFYNSCKFTKNASIKQIPITLTKKLFIQLENILTAADDEENETLEFNNSFSNWFFPFAEISWLPNLWRRYIYTGKDWFLATNLFKYYGIALFR